MGGQLSTEDRLELRELVDRYADAVDRRDDVAFASLFTIDGVLRVQADGAPVENEWTGPEVTRSFDTLRLFHRTFHHVGGAVFLPEADGASGRVRCLAHHYQRTDSGPVDLVMMIVYHDRYLRPAGAWRIAERQVAIEWTELHPAHPNRRVRR